MELIRSARHHVRILQSIHPLGMQALISAQQVRHRQTKHWKPEFKKQRKEKFIRIEIPNLREKPEDLSPEEVRTRMKERGILPARPWLERPFYISCTGGIFEPYVPPEGDGKKSIISKTGALQKFQFLEKKSKSMMAIRKVRAYEEDFETSEFPNIAQDIYINAHMAMALKDKHRVRELITERCYPEMMHNVTNKTIRWKFLQSLEPPRIVHARVTDVVSKENLFAQVTVRFHTQQLLTIYDRFGRLMHGSEIIAKDVLEYVVFEKHISNEYGQWRMHDKIIPDWLPPRQPAPKTYRLIEDEPQALEQVEALQVTEPEPAEQKQVQQQQQSTAATTAAPAAESIKGAAASATKAVSI